jgi:hypothetical protein
MLETVEHRGASAVDSPAGTTIAERESQPERRET